MFLAFSLFAGPEEELAWEYLPSVIEYSDSLHKAIRDERWRSAIGFAEIIANYFPESPVAEESSFLMGEAYFKLGVIDAANESFSAYLNNPAPRHFEEAIHYKFDIAERFRNGERKHLFSNPTLPRLLSGTEDAIGIYDEVITALPHDEIAAKSLLGKAQLQLHFEDFKPSIETLDLLIRRFPKHELAAQGFLEKSHVYLKQSQEKDFDSALLNLADANLRKFRLAFPREERISDVEHELGEIQEIFAERLMEIGRFFQKTKKIPASILYYTKVINQYPATKAAAEANEKLHVLQG